MYGSVEDLHRHFQKHGIPAFVELVKIDRITETEVEDKFFLPLVTNVDIGLLDRQKRYGKIKIT